MKLYLESLKTLLYCRAANLRLGSSGPLKKQHELLKLLLTMLQFLKLNQHLTTMAVVFKYFSQRSCYLLRCLITDIQTRTFQSIVYQNTTWKTITQILYSHMHVTLSTLHLKQQHQVIHEKPNFNTVSSLWLWHVLLWKKIKYLLPESEECFSVHCMLPFVTWTFFFCDHCLNSWSQYCIQYVLYVKTPF